MYKVRESNRGYIEVDIRLRLPNGEWVRERRKSPVSGRAATERWAQARERQLLVEGMQPKPKAPPPVVTLREFWPRFLRDHVKANNLKPSGRESKDYGWRTFLDPHLGALRLDEITSQRVAQLKAWMVDQDYAPGTINNSLALLSKMLKMAVEWGEISAMPCRIQRLKKQGRKPKFYDFATYERLVAAAKRLDQRTYLIVLLGGDAGLRRGEIMALDRSACDTERGLISVEWSTWRNHRTATKGMEARTVPMTDRLREVLKAYRHDDGPRLFYGNRGGFVTADRLRQWMVSAQHAAGITEGKGELHILRHTFCSHLAMRGAPALSIQRLAGHKHMVTSLGYMHLAEGEAERAIRLLQRGTCLEQPPEDATFSE